MSYLTFDNNKYLNGIDDNLPLGNNSRGGLKFEVQHAPSEFHYRTLPRVF